MSAPFNRLLGALPNVYDTDAHPEPCLRIVTEGITVEVRRAELRVTLLGPVEHVIALTGTVEDVVVSLQSIGVETDLLRPDLADRSARLFLDTPAFVTGAVSARNDLFVFNNQLWVILRPLGMALEGREERSADALLALNLLTATGYWADVWGKYLGITRRFAETDAAYTARMKHETIRARLNNKALEQVLLDDLGIDARVENLLPLVLIWNETDWHSFWAGNIYNSGAFRVTYATTGVSSAEVMAVIDRHRAAGTRYILVVEQQVSVSHRADHAAHVLQGAEYVWDGRVHGVFQRARADHATTFRPLVFGPNQICTTPGVFLAWGVGPTQKYLHIVSGDYTSVLLPGALAYVLASGVPVWTRIIGTELLGAVTRVYLSIEVPAGKTNLYVALDPEDPTEIAIPRRTQWLPGESAMPGSIITQ